MESFSSIKGVVTGEYKEKGSKFVAFLGGVADPEENTVFIQKIKKAHPKARHHCSASRIFDGKGIEERYDDDGEPSGTGGKPILNMLSKAELVNCVCVVVRYFGGTKLGKPGLARAYKSAAEESIAKGEVVRFSLFNRIDISLPYTMQPAFVEAINKLHLPRLQENFTNRANYSIGLPHTSTEATLQLLLQETTKVERDAIEDYCVEFGIEVLIKEDPPLIIGQG